MTESITIKSSSSIQSRIILGGAIFAAILVAWFGVRWQFGNMLGELTPPGDAESHQIAQLAVGLAPSDPMARWLLAANVKSNLDASNVERSVLILQDVVRLSPNDFRWWVELARTYEQAEKADAAEAAFKRAVELAPSYTFPHWQFGNFYLRQNRTDEAFAELTKTTEKSIVYREQVFSLAWDYFDNDPAKVEQIAANSPDVRASLALFYATRGSPGDSLRIWNSLPDEEKARQPQIASTITELLYSKRLYRESLEFARQTGIDPESAIETIGNGGFERFIGEPKDTLFGWQVHKSDNKVDVITDSAVKKEGLRSLRIKFRNYSKSELYNVVQLVAVQPNAKYSLSFWLRTEDLRTGGEPFVEIVDGKRSQMIGASPRFPLGSNDWQQFTIDFTVPEDCEGIVLRTSRVNCGENCPISGTVWYDDFKISKL